MIYANSLLSSLLLKGWRNRKWEFLIWSNIGVEFRRTLRNKIFFVKFSLQSQIPKAQIRGTITPPSKSSNFALETRLQHLSWSSKEEHTKHVYQREDVPPPPKNAFLFVSLKMHRSSFLFVCCSNKTAYCADAARQVVRKLISPGSGPPFTIVEWQVQ